MTISVWRYSHLALAVSSFIFITLAAVTGIILAFQPITEKLEGHRIPDFNKVTIAETVPALKKSFTEITEVTVDANQYVIVTGLDTSDNDVEVYVNPRTGTLLGTPPKKSEFFQFVTTLHRSLFLRETGRFFVGLTAFLLSLIVVSGVFLLLQRQRSVKRFFGKINKESFSQYYHIVLGRLSLIFILIIALSGTYLSLVRFEIFPEKKISHKIDFDAVKSDPEIPASEFKIFKNIHLSEVQSIEFPFSDDPEDYYTLKLNDRELVINQFTGETLSEVPYPVTQILSSLSLDLHTGRASAIWAIVLAIAAANILFFIYSGFAIMLKRRRGSTRNKFKAKDSRFIILLGTENGSTRRFAKAVYQHLLKNGESVFLAALNEYNEFPKAEHLIILTATYGLGDAPANGVKFLTRLKKHPQTQPVLFSVVGFGSHGYPDFCKFGFEVHNELSRQHWAKPLLEIHTVNDKSPQDFAQWFSEWSQKVNLPFSTLPDELSAKPTGLQKLLVVDKTPLAHEDGAFLLRLRPKRGSRFNSGDLLAIYPADDYRERLYSIGKIGNSIQLSVKLHTNGLGSGYLHALKQGTGISARIVANAHFQFPAKAPAVIMISNGTGIAPFLGMIDENSQKTPCFLYCGFRDDASFSLYDDALGKNWSEGKVKQVHIAYSREGAKEYVKDLLKRDIDLVTEVLRDNGVVMLCGSLAMQNDVVEILDAMCRERNGKDISYYQSHGRVLMDCY